MIKLTTHMRHLIEDAVYSSMAECGSCGSYHPADWVGDCRDDEYRYHPDDMIAFLFAAFDLLEGMLKFRQWLEGDNSYDAGDFLELVDKVSYEAIEKVKGG